MKKVVILTIATATILTSCICKPGDLDICTQELRTIMINVTTPAHHPAALDSAFTTRANGEKITYQYQGGGYYTVLDDTYHAKLKNNRDNFTFHGYRGGVKVVQEPFVISADNCHIRKVSGKDSVVVQ